MKELSTFVENEIHIENKTIFIYQQKYANRILKEFKKIHNYRKDLFCQKWLKIRRKPDEQLKASTTEITKFQQHIDSLLYLILKTRLELIFTIIKLNRFLKNP